MSILLTRWMDMSQSSKEEKIVRSLWVQIFVITTLHVLFFIIKLDLLLQMEPLFLLIRSITTHWSMM